MNAIPAFVQKPFVPLQDIKELQNTMLQVVPPLKNKSQIINPSPLLTINNMYIDSLLSPMQVPVKSNENQIQVSSKELELERQKLDHKERNRIAAQKWRAKKDETLLTLEEENDILRKKVFDLQAQSLQLNVENRILDSELQYFQHFMSKIMSVNPKK